MQLNTMRFLRIGTHYQLRIDHAEDLAAVLALDKSLWAATSAPVSAFHCDRVLLEFLDSDRSGRITSDELKAAVAWLLPVLRSSRGVTDGSETLVLSDLRTESPLGAALEASARHVACVLGQPEHTEIGLADVRRFQAVMRAQPLNGDGVIVPTSTDEADLRLYLADAVACTGGRADASGQQGVDAEQLSAFQSAVRAQLAWRQQALPQADGAPVPVLPFGDQTPVWFELLRTLAPRIDRYFALCGALRFAPAAVVLTADRVAAGQETLAPWEADDADLRAHLARLPLAVPRADGRLPLDAGSINPVDWSDLERLRDRVLVTVAAGGPVDTLDAELWARTRLAFQPYGDYLAAQPGVCAASLTVETLKRYADGKALDRALALVAADRAVGALLKGVVDLERLLLYQANLLRVTNNFINFSELYDTRKTALFEMGAAVIDGRWFSLALSVEDMATHMAMARSSGLFTLYAELQRAGEEKRTVALPATAYTRGNLVVGKRGVFFDRAGRESDLRIVQIIDNPISFREALYAPFVRIWDFLVGKIESIATANEKQLQQSVDGITPSAAPGGGAARPAVFSGPAGVMLGVSMSMAAMGSAVAFITRTLGSMKVLNLLGGLLAGVALLMLPLSLIAVTKLMRQDLSGLLEASGWAINARLRLTWAQRRQFTRRHPYPPRAEGLPSRVRPGFWLALGLMLLVWIVWRRYGA